MDLVQRSNPWLEARKGKITASNCGALLGLVSWTSRAEAYRRLIGISKFEGNAACDYGTNMESAAISCYEIHTGNKVYATGLHTHPQNRWIAGSPDGFVGHDGMIEVKCPYYNKIPHEKVPNHYYLQMNCLMECTGKEWCDFVSWTPRHMTTFRVTRDTDLFSWLLSNPYNDILMQVKGGNATITPFRPGEKQEIEERIQQSMATHIDYDHYKRKHKWGEDRCPFEQQQKKRSFDCFLTGSQEEHVSSEETGLPTVSAMEA